MIENDDLAIENELIKRKFPCLRTISAAFMYDALPVPLKPEPAELVYFKYSRDLPIKERLCITMWNKSWETAHLRNEVQWDDVEFPKEIQYLKDREKNVYLIPLTKSIRYHAYAPLFHLLPAAILKKHGLPLIKTGLWPFGMSLGEEDSLPYDFDHRLSNAFSEYIWPLLSDQARYAFSKDDPIKILSHNLDHWLPYIYRATEEIARNSPLTEPQENFWKVQKANKSMANTNNLLIRPPYCGGDLWTGEDEALKVAKRMVEISDSDGKLRSIIDAINSNRIDDDFSEKWSTQKVDFERQVFKSRMKVTFVELRNAAPIHGPWTEFSEGRLWSDLAAIVNPKDRRVIVFLREGTTSVGEISEMLGYKNHSPVSKALARIRIQPTKLLEK